MEGSNNYENSRDVTITTPEVHNKTNDLILFGQIGIGLTLIVIVILLARYIQGVKYERRLSKYSLKSKENTNNIPKKYPFRPMALNSSGQLLNHYPLYNLNPRNP